MGGVPSRKRKQIKISKVSKTKGSAQINANSIDADLKETKAIISSTMVAQSDDSVTDYTTVAETLNRSKLTSTLNSRVAFDEYPIYNPIDDTSFESGKAFQAGCYPVDSTKRNIGIVGRAGCGKSALINALRGVTFGDKYAAGRYRSERMEPFAFIEDEFKDLMLWEIPYPQTINSVIEVYDRYMGFDRFYEKHKLGLFELVMVLLPDGDLHDDDASFSRIVHSRQTPLIFIKSKADDDLDIEARERNLAVGEQLKKRYIEQVCHVFSKILHQKAQVLEDVKLLFISSTVIQDILCETSTSLQYEIDEQKLIALLNLSPGCHQTLQNDKNNQTSARDYSSSSLMVYNSDPKASMSLRYVHPEIQSLPTVLADAGFEISYGTDDRICGTFETRCSVRRAGKTTFAYGFAGGSGVGKSALINGIRGMSAKHPLAAGRTRIRQGSCQRYDFDDDLLAYNVTLWELHYPKRISAYFEFIDQYQLPNFTAIFIIINRSPTEEDLTFAKIAFRRNATIVFLLSKCDKILMARSRSEEIPVGDLLKQQIVDKGILKLDRILSTKAPELRGRVHLFFVSAPVFKSLKSNGNDSDVFLLHEKAVFDFLKQKRMIAEMLDSLAFCKEGLYATVNEDGAITPTSPVSN